MSRLSAVFLTLGLLSGALGSVACPGSAVSDAEQVKQLQSDLVDAYIHHDVAILDRVLADDYTFTNQRGEVESKEQVLSNFRAGGDRTITSYEIHNPQIRVYGDAAVMIYGYTSKEHFKDRDDGGSFRITRVFIRANGRWRIVAGHETRLAPQE